MAEAVYLHYDQAELDRQLNLRARWPEHPEHLARWAEDSAALRRTLGGETDLAFGPSAGERLDLFVPPGAATPPLMVFIHGGYQVSIEEIVRQIRAALAWLYREGGAHGIDPERLFVSGHSAGGHLVGMALATDWPALDPGLPADLVKGGVSVSGVYDLEAIRLSYHQKLVQLDPDMARRMSPLGNLPKSAGPLVAAVGSEETEEFHRQQAAYLAAWRSAGLAAEVVELAGRNHFTAIDALGQPGHPLFATAAALCLGGPP
jgi:arylformamidase